MENPEWFLRSFWYWEVGAGLTGIGGTPFLEPPLLNDDHDEVLKSSMHWSLQLINRVAFLIPNCSSSKTKDNDASVMARTSRIRVLANLVVCSKMCAVWHELLTSIHHSCRIFKKKNVAQDRI